MRKLKPANILESEVRVTSHGYIESSGKVGSKVDWTLASYMRADALAHEDIQGVSTFSALEHDPEACKMTDTHKVTAGACCAVPGLQRRWNMKCYHKVNCADRQTVVACLQTHACLACLALHTGSLISSGS